MKTSQSEVILPAVWKEVAVGVLQKYPNSKNDRVNTVDVLGVSSLGADQALVVDRLMGTKWDVPSWVLKFAGIRKEALVRETFSICPKKKVLVHVSENISFSNLIKAEETLIYSRLETDASKTLLSQRFTIMLPQVPGGVTEYFEQMVLDRNSKSMEKGRSGLMEVVSKCRKTESL